ncbi:MAG: hypothetical protein HRU19_23030 [Pseudobacteriovorax sp.]|nr:hypothetical protein [Pseudobacteriovorax sp.]
MSPYIFNGLPAGIKSGPAEFSQVFVVLFSYIAGFLVSVAISIERNIEPKPFRIYIFVCCLMVFLANFGPNPWVDDDIYRYLWDGYQNYKGNSPLTSLPLHPAEGFPEALREKISYSDTGSIYPPLAQWFFQFLWTLFGSSLQMWTMSFSLVTVSAIVLLVMLARKNRCPERLSVFMIFQPIFVKEFGDSAHLDIVALIPLVIAINISLELKEDRRLASPKLMLIGILIGLGSSVKLFPILFVPFLPIQSLLAKLFVGLTALICVIVISYLYYEDIENVKYAFLLLDYFRNYWIFHPGFTDLIRQVYIFFTNDNLGHQSWWYAIKIGHYITGFIYITLAVTAQIYKKKSQLIGLWAIGLYVAGQSTVNMWYLVWLWPIILSVNWAEVRVFYTIPWLTLPLPVSFGYIFWIANKDIAFIRVGSWLLWFAFTIIPCTVFHFKIKRAKPHLENEALVQSQ